MFSLESPHRGDSNEYTKSSIFNIKKKKKITLNYPESAAMEFFQGTQERVRNSRGKRAISVRAIEFLLYLLSFSGSALQILSVGRIVLSYMTYKRRH